MRTGWLAWLVWSLAAGLFCFGFFQRLAPSVIIDPLMRDLQVGGAVLGNLSAFYFYAYAGLQIPVGLLADRWGPRRMLTLGALLCAAGTLCFALAGQLSLAYLGRLVTGIGAGFGFVCALRLAVNWFPADRFGRVSGLTMLAGMLGGILGQAPLAAAVEALGWRTTLGATGLAGLLLAALIWLVVRDRPESGAGGPAGRPAEPTTRAALAAVLSRPQNWLVALVCAAMSAPLLGFAGLWGVAWLMQVYGFSRPEAAATTSLLLIGWAAGSPLAGAATDRLGRQRLPLLVALIAAAGALAVLIGVPRLPVIALSALFLACGLGLGSTVIAFAMLRRINPPEVTGAAFGFVNTAMVGSGAVFQPLIGWLLDRGWDGTLDAGARVYGAGAYAAAFSVLLLFLGCGLAALVALGEPRAVAEPGGTRG